MSQLTEYFYYGISAVKNTLTPVVTDRKTQNCKNAADIDLTAQLQQILSSQISKVVQLSRCLLPPFVSLPEDGKQFACVILGAEHPKFCPSATSARSLPTSATAPTQFPDAGSTCPHALEGTHFGSKL